MKNDYIHLNLRRLRIAKRITQEDLAKKAGLSRMALSSLEKGTSKPRVKNLEKISAALSITMRQILAPPPEISNVRFRCAQECSKNERTEREQVIRDVSFWLKDYHELEKIVKVNNKKKLDNIRKASMKNSLTAAKYIRRLLKLTPHEPIYDICDKIEAFGIKLYFKKFETQKTCGVSLYHDEYGAAIVVNDLNTVERRIFTIAHELGHLIMHKKSFNVEEIFENNIEEKEANDFAANLLIPEDAFFRNWKENKGLHWIDNVLKNKRIFRVSYQTVLRRLVNNDFADYSALKESFKYDFEKKYQKKIKSDAYEPFGLDEIDFVEDGMSKLIRIAYENDKISLSRSAELLNISIDEMRNLSNDWAKYNGER